MPDPILPDLVAHLQAAPGWGTTVWPGPLPADHPVPIVAMQTYPADPSRLPGATGVPADERWNVQVRTIADSQAEAESIASDAWLRLHFRYATLASGRHYDHSKARQMPAPMGLDDRGRSVIVFNLAIRRDNTQHLD